MNVKWVKGLFIFAAGFAIGAVGTRQYLKTKYQKYAEGEIQEIKAMYDEKHGELDIASMYPSSIVAENPFGDEYTQRLKDILDARITIKHKDVDENKTKAAIKSSIETRQLYDKQVNDFGYSDGDYQRTDTPYIISPDMYGEYDDYEQADLIYYDDKVVADDAGAILSDEEVNEVVGLESLNHFGEYEEDAVYVRNDRLKCDYEIVRDEQTYEEMLVDQPWRR